MKLNRRSFIQKTLAMLAALAAGLRGDAAPTKKRYYYGRDTTMEIDGVDVTVGKRPYEPYRRIRDAWDVTLANQSIARFPTQRGIPASAVAERIRELGDESQDEWIGIPMDNHEKVTVIIT